MKYVLCAEKMQMVDQQVVEHIGIPSLVLIERAALGVTGRLFQRYSCENCLIVVGVGNNGADGLAIARQLMEKGYEPKIYICGNLEKATSQFHIQYQILQKLGAVFLKKLEIDAYSVIVDAIFGVGLSREVQGAYKAVISFMNQLQCPIVSVDIPSGIDATTGRVLGEAVKADSTVTFGFLKTGLLLYPGASYAGNVILKGAGFHEQSLIRREEEAYIYERKDLKNLMPKRTAWSNKGTYGKLLVIAGGNELAGAAALASKGAFATGCGMVKLCTGKANRDSLIANIPELMIATWEQEEEAVVVIEKQLEWADAIVFGPGMGMSNMTRQILEFILQKAKVPVLLDADALNVLAQHKELIRECQNSVIITPHIKEFSRLNGYSIEEIQQDLLGKAREFAKQYPVLCVVKDARTVVTKEGEIAYINVSGNNGMATAGSGDVLSGIIGGLLAQGVEPRKSATFGVYLHGLAGDYAKEAMGVYSMTARDIIKHLKDVLGGKKYDTVQESLCTD